MGKQLRWTVIIVYSDVVPVIAVIVVVAIAHPAIAAGRSRGLQLKAGRVSWSHEGSSPELRDGIVR